MRLRFAKLLIAKFAAVLGLLLALLPWHAFIATWGGTAIGPLLVWKSWKELLLVVLVPLVIIYLVLRPDVWKTIWGRLINKLLFLYLLIHLFWAVMSPASGGAVLAGLAFNLRFLAVFVLAQIVVASGSPIVHKLKRLAVPWLLWVTIILSVMAIVQVLFLPADFLANFGYNKDTTIAPFILVDQNQDALRAFATMRGPNELGSFLILPLMLSLALVIDQRRNILAGVALGLGAFALILTGSRSAWLGAIVALAVLGFLWIPRKRMTKWLIWGGAGGLLVGGVMLLLATSIPSLRLAIFHSSQSDPYLFEGSTEKHWQATFEGAKNAAAHPLGQGEGTAGPASYYNGNDLPRIAENYYVQVAQETGVIGLITFLAINVLLVMQLWKQRTELWAKLLLASFAGLSVINLFLHGWVDDPTAMTWWLMAGLYAFVPHQHDSKIKAKA